MGVCKIQKVRMSFQYHNPSVKAYFFAGEVIQFDTFAQCTQVLDDM